MPGDSYRLVSGLLRAPQRECGALLCRVQYVHDARGKMRAAFAQGSPRMAAAWCGHSRSALDPAR